MSSRFQDIKDFFSVLSFIDFFPDWNTGLHLQGIQRMKKKIQRFLRAQLFNETVCFLVD